MHIVRIGRYSPVAAAILAVASIAVTGFGSAVAAEDSPSAAVLPATPHDHAAEAAKYLREAEELEAKASRHSDMAKSYDIRATGGTKQNVSFRSIAEHCRSLSKKYKATADEARAMAQVHETMTDGK